MSELKYYVHYKTCEEIYGVLEEFEGYCGPYNSFEEAWAEMEKMDQEEWLSGQSVYYCTYVCTEKEKKNSSDA